MAQALKKFDSFKSTFPTKKYSVKSVCIPIGSCLVEIPFLTRNYTYYKVGTMGTEISLGSSCVL